MNKKIPLFFILSFGLFFAGILPAAAEKLTLTTYYPSPYGIYKNFTTTDKTILAQDGSQVYVGPEAAGTSKLIVSGDTAVSGDLYAGGNLDCGGTASATVKAFVIKHPTKPGKKLVHACVEGPEVAVFYRGTARLAEGKAVVRLPDYFEALTREEGRTVQLTPKGRIPFLLSASEVADGEFTVYAQRENGEFYWEVKAVRDDVGLLIPEQPASPQ